MSKKFNGISAKGYYIALILCAAAIGISGYLYYRNANDTPSSLENDPAATADATVDATVNDNVQAVATQPNASDTTQASDATVPSTARSFKTASPVTGETIATYAMDTLSYNQTTRDWRTHDGMDIAADAGTVVCAAADGEVYTVYEDDTMGTTVVIRHADGYTTKYASLATDVAVAAGDQVTVGQTIGYVGNTALLENAIGDHVHFSVTCNDEPVDPAQFLTQE